jgi:peptidoglycan/xylan/chitin deacetylase (PgdA/CDA1 family)
LLTVSLPSTPTQILTATVTVTAPLTPTATPEPNATPLPNLADAPVTLPILMYHYISIPPTDADIYRRDLSISPANFEAQMAYLQAEGYTSISPDDLLYHLARQTPLPEKPILITFDDGYRDNYTNAFPILQKYGFHGTFSLVTDPIDFNDDRYLTWAQVQEMHQAGMDFGAHTRRHLDLRQRSLEFLEDEVLTSKQKIEAQLNVPITFFVYPAGRYDARTLSAVREWFWLAVTTQYGASHRYAERYELSRIRIEGEDTLEIFATKLEALR